MKLSALIQDYLIDLETVQNCSPNTLKSYSHYLNVFLDFTRDEKTPREITPQLIKFYTTFLNEYTDPQSQNPIKKATQNYFLIALRSFLIYLKKRGIETLDPELIKLSPQKRENPQIVEEDLIKKLLSAPDYSSKEGVRDRAILSLISSTGLLVSEISRLNRSNLHLDKNTLEIEDKKLSKRVVEFPDSAKKLLQTYLILRADSFSPLFIRYKGNIEPENEGEKMRLSERSIERMIEKYSKKLNLKVKVTPQLLRHSFAASLINQGKKLEEVQKKLGHSSILSTQVYLKNKQLSPKTSS